MLSAWQKTQECRGPFSYDGLVVQWTVGLSCVTAGLVVVIFG